MFKIKDSNNELIYEGIHGKEVYRVLTANPEDISEQDELEYEHILRTSTWTGKLRLLEYDNNDNLIINIKFKGVDDWNRPVFKDVDRSVYFGSTNKLFDWSDSEEVIVNYFKDNPNVLEYFGSSFNCEPNGGILKHSKLNII